MAEGSGSGLACTELARQETLAPTKYLIGATPARITNLDREGNTLSINPNEYSALYTRFALEPYGEYYECRNPSLTLSRSILRCSGVDKNLRHLLLV
jgi:hypothetical protein